MILFSASGILFFLFPATFPTKTGEANVLSVVRQRDHS